MPPNPDEVVIIRPGSDPAFALGLANVIIQEKLYDEEYVSSSTDLPFLVRMDTLKLLRAEKRFSQISTPPQEAREVKIIKKGEKPPAPIKQGGQQHLSQDL